MFGVKRVSKETLVTYLNSNPLPANLFAIVGEILLDSRRPVDASISFMVTTNLCAQPLIGFGRLAQRSINPIVIAADRNAQCLAEALH